MHAFSAKFLRNLKAETSWLAGQAAGWRPAACAPHGTLQLEGPASPRTRRYTFADRGPPLPCLGPDVDLLRPELTARLTTAVSTRRKGAIIAGCGGLGAVNPTPPTPCLLGFAARGYK